MGWLQKAVYRGRETKALIGFGVFLPTAPEFTRKLFNTYTEETT
jgi:hypothetical protein